MKTFLQLILIISFITTLKRNKEMEQQMSNTRLEYLDRQVKEEFSNLVWTHKTHEKAADILRENKKRWEVVQSCLSAAVTLGLFATVTNVLPQLSSFTTILSTAASTVLLAVTLYVSGRNFEQEANQHKETALALWEIREKYKTLMYDIKTGQISEKDIEKQRDLLLRLTKEVYKIAPRTSAKAFSRACSAINRGETTTSDADFKKILPPGL